MEPMSTRRSTFTLIIIAVLIVGLVSVMALVTGRQEIRQKAAPTTSLEFLPSTKNISSGEEFTLELKINTGTNQITKTDLTVVYDKNYLQGISFVPDSFLPNVTTNGTIGGGTAHMVLEAPSTEPKSGSGTLAKITFKALQEIANTSVLFGQGTQVLAVGEAGSVATVLGEAQITVMTAVVPETVISIDPANAEVNLNDEFKINVDVNTGNNNVTAVTLKVAYDKTKLQGIEIAQGDFLPNCLGSCIGAKGQIGNGTATISLGSNAEEPKQGTGHLANLTFKAIAAGTSIVVIDPATVAAVIGGANTNVVSDRQNMTLTIHSVSASPVPTATPNATPNPTPTSEPAATNNPQPTATPGTGGYGCSKTASSVPPNLTAAASEYGKVILFWDRVANVTHYGIMYGVESGKYLYGAANIGNVTQYTVTGLQAGKTYYFVVFAVNDCVASGNSNQAYVTTLGGLTGGTNTEENANLVSSPAPEFIPINSSEFTDSAVPSLATPSPVSSPEVAVSIPPDYAQKSKTTGNPLLSPLGGIFLIIASLFVGAFFIFVKRQ